MDTKYKYILAALTTAVLAGGAYYYYIHYMVQLPEKKEKAASKAPAKKKAPVKKKKAPAKKKKSATKKKPAQTQAPVDDDNFDLFERYLNNVYNAETETEALQWLNKLTEPLVSDDIIKEVTYLVQLCEENPSLLYDNVETFLDKWDQLFPDVEKPSIIELGEISD